MITVVLSISLLLPHAMYLNTGDPNSTLNAPMFSAWNHPHVWNDDYRYDNIQLKES